jgi:hypothetical protein
MEVVVGNNPGCLERELKLVGILLPLEELVQCYCLRARDRGLEAAKDAGCTCCAFCSGGGFDGCWRRFNTFGSALALPIRVRTRPLWVRHEYAHCLGHCGKCWAHAVAPYVSV